MLEDLKSTLREAETKADVAVVLGAGTLGAVVDLIVSAHGALSPGVAAGLSASGALSAKKGWDARKDAKRALGKAKDAHARAKRMLDFFTQRHYDAGVASMSTQLELYDHDIIGDEQLDEAVGVARIEFLAWAKDGG